MKNRILVTVMLLCLLFGMGSCVMHYEGYGKARGRGGYYHGSSHRYGNSRHHSVRSSYWGKHRYGPRPHPYRGRYR